MRVECLLLVVAIGAAGAAVGKAQPLLAPAAVGMEQPILASEGEEQHLSRKYGHGTPPSRAFSHLKGVKKATDETFAVEKGNQTGAALPLYIDNASLPGDMTQDSIADVRSPFMLPFLCAEPPSNGFSCPTVLILPGGGYQHIDEPGEGVTVAARLQRMGFSSFVVHYRVPANTPVHGPDGTWSPPIDAQRAIRLVRANAHLWHGRVNASSLGVLGFSAGGAIAQIATAAASPTHSPLYPPMDFVDEYSARPDYLVLLYPGGTNTTRYKETQHDSIISATGKLTLPVSADQPPTFIAVARDDNSTGYEGSVALYRALVRTERGGAVSTETETWTETNMTEINATSFRESGLGSRHKVAIFEDSGLGHGFGVCDEHGVAFGMGCHEDAGCPSRACEWPYAVQRWLKTGGFLG